jgi:hypothetical protein
MQVNAPPKTPDDGNRVTDDFAFSDQTAHHRLSGMALIACLLIAHG